MARRFFTVALLIFATGCSQTDKNAVAKKFTSCVERTTKAVEEMAADRGSYYPLNEAGSPARIWAGYQKQLTKKAGTAGLWEKWNGPYNYCTDLPLGMNSKIVLMPSTDAATSQTGTKANLLLEISGTTHEQWRLIENIYDGWGNKSRMSDREASGKVIFLAGVMRVHLLAIKEPLPEAGSSSDTALDERTIIKGLKTATGKRLPFTDGEQITFSMNHWFTPDVAKATMSVKVVGGGNIRFNLNAKTTEVIENLWSMDDSFSSIWSMDENYAKNHTSKIRETGTSKDKEVTFQHAEGVAVEQKGGKPPKKLPMLKGSMDFLSAIYYTRTLPLQIGKSYPLHLFEDGKNYDLNIRAVAVEHLKILGKKMELLKVVPHLAAGEGKAKGEVAIWLTNDEARVPVKIEVKSFFGSISVVISSYKR